MLEQFCHDDRENIKLCCFFFAHLPVVCCVLAVEKERAKQQKRQSGDNREKSIFTITHNFILTLLSYKQGNHIQMQKLQICSQNEINIKKHKTFNLPEDPDTLHGPHSWALSVNKEVIDKQLACCDVFNPAV